MRTVPALVAIALSIGAGGYLAQARAGRDVDDQARLAKALAGYAAGAPTGCIPIAYPSLSTTVYGKTILYRSAVGGTIYRNDTAGGCESAANGDILVSVQYQGRPCSGDIIRTVEPLNRIPTGSCALGQFVAYKKIR